MIRRRSNAMHVGLWVAQVVAAGVFLVAGATKLTAPVEQLQQTMPWVNGAMGGAVRIIGTAEIAGALGLIVPAVTRIKPWLTPVAAGGLATIMMLATLTHLVRAELAMAPITLGIGSLVTFVAWGRYRKAPIAPRA